VVPLPVSFILADLIVLPILDIDRTCYGGRVALYIAAGHVVEVLLDALGIVPTQRAIAMFTEGPRLNYTSVVNLLFLVLAAVLVWRFLGAGGPAMLRMMNMAPPAEPHEHGSPASA
jgi:hypothetical protein